MLFFSSVITPSMNGYRETNDHLSLLGRVCVLLWQSVSLFVQDIFSEAKYVLSNRDGSCRIHIRGHPRLRTHTRTHTHTHTHSQCWVVRVCVGNQMCVFLTRCCLDVIDLLLCENACCVGLCLVCSHA